MRHARRFIATLIGVAIWCFAAAVAATTVAYAKRPDPVTWDPSATPIAADQGTSGWQIAAIVALAALMTVAVVGLVASQRHARPSRPSPMAHA